jgi:hypothetical protein
MKTPRKGARRHRRGALKLVLLGAATGSLVACGADPNDQPQELARASYASAEECAQDWGDAEQCEPQLVSSGPTNYSSDAFNPEGWQGGTGGSSGAGGAGYGGYAGGPRYRWWGPYFNRSGQVYHYDGRITALRSPPAHANAVVREMASLNEVYGLRGGRYATTPAHAEAAAVKSTARGAVARGGFGSIGRGGSGGG